MERLLKSKLLDKKTFLSILLVCGTSIGAGMLGLPVATCDCGLLPSIYSFVLTYLIMILSGIFLAEVVLKKPPGMNFLTLSREILGSRIGAITCLFYLLLFYSLLVAYTKSIGVLFSVDFSVSSSTAIGSTIFILCAIPLIYKGTKVVGQLNALLTFILFTAFIFLSISSISHIQFENWQYQNYSKLIPILPLLVSSFGFHGTLPSLVEYLERDKKKIYFSIIIGSTITLAVYLIWELIVFGLVPIKGAISLTSAYQNDQTAITPISQLVSNPHIVHFAHIFSISAILTSFFGVSLGFFDFIIDWIKPKKIRRSRLLIILIVYISALLLTMTPIKIFHYSLIYGSGLSAIYLLILLPTFLFYKLERKANLAEKILLSCTTIFSLFSLIGYAMNLLNFRSL